MRSTGSVPSPRRLCVAALAACLVLGAFTTAHSRAHAQERSSNLPDAPTADDITRALDALRRDPDLGPERTFKTLRWKGSTPSAGQRSWWLDWAEGFGTWMTESTRYLVWVAIGVAAVLLARYLFRIAGRREGTSGEDTFVAPTHVGEWDIRPDALPSDIGAAAKALWDSGEHRAALALLYRGLLSRLAHRHRVPIRDSSTEGDCLALAAAHAAPLTHEYAARLVRVWIRSVYGHEAVSARVVHGLCDEFNRVLDRPLTGDSLAAGGAV